MTLKPIQGAPTGAPIPDFPTGDPGSVIVPTSSATLRSFDSAPTPSPARWPGPVEFRGKGDSVLTFKVIPEVPAINRASMTVSIVGEPTGDYSTGAMPHLELATDEAKAFLLALRDGDPPIAIIDRRTAFQVEFAIAADGPTFTASKPGQARTSRQFRAGSASDVKMMAAHLLADLGP
jgi:hypothetical protein